MIFRGMAIVIAGLVLCCPCTSCTAFFVPTSTTDVYLMSLDIDKIPPEVSDLKGEGIIYNLPFIGFMSHGYFDYKAEASYFTRFEKQILQVPCQTLSTDFSYWEKDGFKGEFIKSDQCFSGTIGPYLHYIFYDSSSRRVQHFVTGIRD